MKAGLLMHSYRRAHAHRSQQGFSLLELLVAVVLFTVISGVAFTLLSQQQNASQGLQGQVALNMALRNTESLLQMDLANAGNGYYQIQNMANGVLGVAILNNFVASGSNCNTAATGTGMMAATKNYGTNCFDQLNIVSFVDPTLSATPVLNPTAAVNVHSSSTVTATVTSGFTIAQAVAAFHVGDYLLFLTNNGPVSNGATFPAYTVVKITSITSTANTITFGFTPTTNSNGSNSLANDPFNITACSGTTPCPPITVTGSAVNNNSLDTFSDNYLTASFATTDYILKIVPVTYQVCNGPGSPTTATGALYSCDQTATSPDIANPKLWRTIRAGGVTTSSMVMEQMLGFKAGASIWNDPDPDPNVPPDVPYFNYSAATYTVYPNNISVGNNPPGDRAFNFSAVHSVRVSAIGRTVPATTANYVYRNQFDGGPYQVQAIALVVNPRNLNQQSY